MVSMNQLPSITIQKQHFTILTRDTKDPTKRKDNNSHHIFDDYLCNFCDYKISKFQLLVDHLREEHL